MRRLAILCLPVVLALGGFGLGRKLSAVPQAQTKKAEPAPDLLKFREDRLRPDTQYVTTSLSTRDRAVVSGRHLFKIEDDKLTLKLRRQGWTGADFAKPYIYQSRVTLYAAGEKEPLCVMAIEPVVMKPGKLTNEIIPIEIRAVNPGDYDVEFTVYEPSGPPQPGEAVVSEGGRFWRLIHSSQNEIRVR